MGPTDGLSLKIWKQQKLIDFLEESEEIDVDGVDCVATYYKTDLEGMDYDWSRYTEDEWHKMHIC